MITYHNACCLKDGSVIYQDDGRPYILLEKCIVDYSNPGWFQLQVRSLTKIGDTGFDYLFVTPSNASTFSLKDSKNATTKRRIGRLSSTTSPQKGKDTEEESKASST